MAQKSSLIKITIYWTLSVLVIGVISGAIANSKASGGEQKLFTYIAFSIAIALAGIVLINLVSLFIDREQGLRNRAVSVGFIIVCLIFLYPSITAVGSNQYDVVEKTRYVGSDTIDIKLEYYPSNNTPKRIRSERFWKNGKKDSLWTVYSKNGDILKQ